MIKIFNILLFFILLIAKSGFTVNKYQETFGFEKEKNWKGIVLSTKYVKEGEYSGLWKDMFHTVKITTTRVPHNWSQYDAITFWVYSEKANKAEIEMVIDSDNPETELKDRFRQTIYINWNGWKKIKFKFSEFRVDRSPAGFNKIDGIRFAAAGYSKVPKKDTVLYFDKMELVKEPIDVDITSRYKNFDDKKNYINYIRLTLFNNRSKTIKYKIKINKKKLKYFKFIERVRNKFYRIKGNGSNKLELKFKISKKDYLKVKRYYNERVSIRVEGEDQKVLGGVELKLYAPFYKNGKKPHIYLTKSEIEEAREKYKRFKWARDTISGFIRTAKKYSSGKIPRKCGGFYHGGPTAKDYPIYLKHENFSRAARYYAIAFAITGNRKYLDKSKRILLEYSKILPMIKVRDKYGNLGREAWIGGGRWGPQILTDCKLLIFYAYAYDIIRDYLTSAEREKIEKNIFSLESDLLMRNNEGRHNHQIWYDMTLGIMGYLLGDAEYLDFALNSEESGFFPRILKTSFTKENWYYERSVGYHYYVLYALTWFLEAAYHSGDNYYRLPQIKKIYKAPLNMLSRDFKFPIINDGRPIEPLLIERGWVYIMTYRRFKDKSFLPIISRIQKEDNIETLLYYPIKDLDNRGKINFSSVLLPDTQWALLRADNYKSKGNDFYVWFNYTPNIATHCHPDRLGIVVYGLNDYILPDAGSGKYRSIYHKNWFKSTIAHNTVCVDMENQKTYKDVVPYPKLNYYFITPNLKAVSAVSKDVYDGVDFYRTIVMVDDDYLFDYVRLKSKSEHTYDLAYHIKGRPKYISFKPIKKKNFYKGAIPSYELIEDFGIKKLDGDVKVDYKRKNGGVFLYSLRNKKGFKIITGKGAISDYHEKVAKKRVPLIILRKEEQSPEYFTLIEPYKREGNIKSFKNIFNDKGIKIFDIKRSSNIEDTIFINETKKHSGNKTIKSDGDVVYVKKINNKVEFLSANNCKKITLPSGNIVLNKTGSFYIKKINNRFYIYNVGKSKVSIKVNMKIFGKSGVKNFNIVKNGEKVLR